MGNMWEVFGLDQQKLSDLAGSASFVVWLFAQSPQLYENYRNSSCEGLSIVFLAQWMAGDATNLVGCILTQQLPFQVAVATYFCCIDLCILAQYYFYWYRDRQLERQHKSLHRRRVVSHYSSATVAPNMRSSSTQASLSRAAAASDRSTNTSPSNSIYRGNSQTNKRTRPSIQYYHSNHDSSSSYKALSQTARSVADLANEFARRVAVRDASRQEQERRKRAYDSERKKKGKEVERSNLGSEDETEGEMPAKMMNSIYSNSSMSSEDYGYGFGTTSTMLDKKTWPEGGQSNPSSPIGNARGRDMTRTAGKILAFSSSRSPAENHVKAGAPISQNDDQRTPRITAVPLSASQNFSAYPARPTNSRSTTRTNTSSRSAKSPAASRGAGIVLLGLTALFGLQSRNATVRPALSISQSYKADRAYVVPMWNVGNSVEMEEPAFSATRMTLSYTPYPQSSPRTQLYHDSPPFHPPWQRIVGRVSAWICTVLYMTSRLPQIWTNLSRKSVQGLSILLFISAALGNALYSASVLINPLASGSTRKDYLRESLPFLLGSGGTLIFDAIIVFQWIAWRGNAPMVEVSHLHQSTMSNNSNSFTFRGSSRTSGRERGSLERQPLLE